MRFGKYPFALAIQLSGTMYADTVVAYCSHMPPRPFVLCDRLPPRAIRIQTGRIVATVLLGVMPAATVRAQAPARWQALAEVDAAVRWFHPVVATRTTPWDSVFAAHVVHAATVHDTAALRQSLTQMLAVIGDQATHVASSSRWRWQRSPLAGPLAVLRPVATTATRTSADAPPFGDAPLVLDLRGISDPLPSANVFERASPAQWTAPTRRRVLYDGFPGTRLHPFFSLRWQYDSTGRLPARPNAPRLVVLVDRSTVLSSSLLALRAQGRALVVGDSTLRGDRTVTLADVVHRVPVARGLEVLVRGNTLAERPDSVLPDTIIVAWDPATLGALARRAAPVVPVVPVVPAVARIAPDTTALRSPLSPDPGWRAAVPHEGYRVLAATRLWSVMRLFNPHRAQFSAGWDAALAAALPAVRAATSQAAFWEAIARMAAALKDTHVVVANPGYGATLGAVPPPIVAQFIEGALLVRQIVDATLIEGTLRVGDEITAIDGETIAARRARLAPLFAVSGPPGYDLRLSSAVLYAADTGIVRTVHVRGADGQERRVRWRSTWALVERDPPARSGPIWQRLESNLGYVDLARLVPAQVDSVFADLGDTEGLVLDMRGYPRATAWPIASYVNRSRALVLANSNTRLRVISPDSAEAQRYTFPQHVPPRRTGRTYDRPTVLLIDEHAISQAEHSGLLLRAANGTRFVGSPTQGADGDVTSVLLPGLMNVTFTGHDVRWPDGHAVQGVGLIPDVLVRPTKDGVRAGRDELLEAAVRTLRRP